MIAAALAGLAPESPPKALLAVCTTCYVWPTFVALERHVLVCSGCRIDEADCICPAHSI